MAESSTMQAIAAALSGERERMTQNSPWLNMSNTFSQAPMGNNNWSTGERAVMAGLTGLFGGFGRGQVNKNMEQLLPEIISAATSDDPVAAFEANEALKKYAPQLQLGQIVDRQAIAAEEAKNQREIAKAYAKKGMRIGEDGSVSGVPGYGQTVAGRKGLEAQASAVGRLGAEAQYAPGIAAAKEAARYPYQVRLAQAKEVIREAGRNKPEKAPTEQERAQLQEMFGVEIPEGVSYRALSAGTSLARAGESENFALPPEVGIAPGVTPVPKRVEKALETKTHAVNALDKIARLKELLATIGTGGMSRPLNRADLAEARNLRNALVTEINNMKSGAVRGKWAAEFAKERIPEVGDQFFAFESTHRRMLETLESDVSTYTNDVLANAGLEPRDWLAEALGRAPIEGAQTQGEQLAPPQGAQSPQEGPPPGLTFDEFKAWRRGEL